jgi:hypothetical protein
MSEQSVSGRWLARGAVAYAASVRRLARVLNLSDAGLEGLLTHALSSAEREAVTVAINSQGKHSGAPRGLFDWERELFARELPVAPARLLLGGAGDGAEALPLTAAGYEVHAFEPASACLPALRAAVGPGGSASELSYHDLLTPAQAAGQLLAREYDAVIFGWGSISHVLDARTRAQLVQLCARLCPRGPILLSFAFGSETEPARQSRAFALGARLGARLASLRDLPQPEAAERERFWPQAGFVHLFSVSELQQLAAAAGRQLRLQEGPYPHAVLTPAAT